MVFSICLRAMTSIAPDDFTFPWNCDCNTRLANPPLVRPSCDHVEQILRLLGIYEYRDPLAIEAPADPAACANHDAPSTGGRRAAI
jgi:hypothetical protein